VAYGAIAKGGEKRVGKAACDVGKIFASLALMVLSFAAISCAKTQPVAASAQPSASAQPAQAVSDPAPAAATPAKSSPKAATSAKSATPTAKTAAKPAQPLGAPVKSYGSPNAPIKMEVFTDYECPSCRNLYENTLKEMINDYVAAGKVYLVHHDYPLPMHKYGYEAARWLNASAEIGKFAPVEEALYDHQNDWAADGNIAKYVSATMSPADFKRVTTIMHGCGFDAPPAMKSASFALGQTDSAGCSVDHYIEADRALGNKVPVQSTPTYVITYKGKQLPVGAGAVSWQILKQFFDSLMAQ
jgi:protein-disulfide isomerase